MSSSVAVAYVGDVESAGDTIFTVYQKQSPRHRSSAHSTSREAARDEARLGKAEPQQQNQRADWRPARSNAASLDEPRSTDSSLSTHIVSAEPGSIKHRTCGSIERQKLELVLFFTKAFTANPTPWSTIPRFPRIRHPTQRLSRTRLLASGGQRSSQAPLTTFIVRSRESRTWTRMH